MPDTLIAAVDVHYDEDRQIGRAAAVVFADWTDRTPRGRCVREHRGLAPYVSGQFYRRELPCILPLLADLRQQTALNTIVVDGHVDLGAGRAGLGRHLHRELGGEIAVVGVAKRSFRNAPSLPVYRGRSQRPLWVSSTGSPELAVQQVRSMHGDDRLPTLLRLVDHLARDLDP